jgi:hypothetical protein
MSILECGESNMSIRQNHMPGIEKHFTTKMCMWLLLCVFTCPIIQAQISHAESDIAFFENKIRPILAEACYGCHSQTRNKSKGGLQLDSREAMLRGGDTGPSLVEGHPDQSLLITAIRYQDKDLQMPPDDPLSTEQIRHFETWIRSGAVFPQSANGLPKAKPAWWVTVNRDDLLSPETSPQQAIDHYILNALKKRRIIPAPRATDVELVRRVTLDLAGRPPTPAEFNDYLFNSSPQRLEEYVHHLIDSPCYKEQQVEEFNWLLMDGKEGELKTYLETAFGENRSWDRIFKEIIVADYQDESAKGAPQFIKERVRDIDQLTNDVSVRFFGVNISCAQCHDHPNVPDWTQASYYGMKSFFGRTFENGGFVTERAYGQVSYKTTRGDTRNAPLQFIDGNRIMDDSDEWNDEQRKAEKEQLETLKQEKKPAPLPPNSRRAKLVQEGLAADQQGYFARALVNRVWYRFMGAGFVEPLDQMHGDNPPSHPELLLWLADWFARSDYDLNGLVEGIVLSKAYQRSSAWTTSDRPAKDTYATANLRVLTPRQYAANLLIGATSPEVFDGCEPSDKKHHEQLGILLNHLDKTASWFERPGDGFYFSVDEALQLSNGKDIRSLLFENRPDGLVATLLEEPNTEKQVEKAYINILNRLPTQSETETMTRFLSLERTQAKNQLESMIWVLLTSPECRLNH